MSSATSRRAAGRDVVVPSPRSFNGERVRVSGGCLALVAGHLPLTPTLSPS